MVELAGSYERSLDKVEAGLDLQIRRIGQDPDNVENEDSLLESLDRLVNESEISFESLSSFRETLVSQYGIDSSLRREYRKIVNSQEKILDSRATIRGWRQDVADAIDSSR